MNLRPQPTRLFALGESLLVSFIWASSFVLVKTALDDVGPLTLAGLRYFGAFIVLLPFMAFNHSSLRRISRPMWAKLLMIGLSAYTVGNGALFWSLKYLPATTGSFLMGLIPLLVLIAAVIWLKEIPARWQVVGAAICLAGNGLFFSQGLQGGEPLGMFIISIGLVSFAAFGILGRAVARSQEIDTLTLTAIPLALGGGVLLVIALPLEGLPNLTPVAIGIVLWLATVNTALAYILYNHSLQTLPALEMNIMLNLSPLLTALLAWLLLAEQISLIQLVGILTVIVGVIFVQARRNSRPDIQSLPVQPGERLKG